MAEVLRNTRRSTVEQVTGVIAQALFGGPALFASLVLAHWSDVAHVAELAITFGTTSTIFVATSFNLTHHLALWGTKGFSTEAFWVNRALASAAAVTLALVLLLLYGANLQLVLLACLVKAIDGTADLRFGLDLLRRGPGSAMQRLLFWSGLRVLIFAGGAVAGRAMALSGLDALLLGGVLQFVLLLPWWSVRPGPGLKRHFEAARRLGRSAAHLSLAATMCGVLVTTPRLMAKLVAAPEELGYIGVVFVCSTLVGMFFNVTWYRLASDSRTSDPVEALRAFLISGCAYGALFVGGFWLSAPVVARLYGIADSRFGNVFFRYGAAFVAFYFVMSLANLLKNSPTKLLESAAYLCAAAALATTAEVTHSLIAGIIAASVVLFLFVVSGVQGVRQLGKQ